MDTKALRQKILDLAIHGKLVPQAPNDEPASVLLERIKAEKERLIKEGKIRAVLRTFLGRLSRNLSINRALHDKARKRGGGEVTAALEELREIGGGSAEEAVEQAELGRLLDRFLRTLPEKECSIFLRPEH